MGLQQHLCCWKEKSPQPDIMPTPPALSSPQVKTLLEDIEGLRKPRSEVTFSQIVGPPSSQNNKYGSGPIFRHFQKRCWVVTKQLDIKRYKALLDEHKVKPNEFTLAEWNAFIVDSFSDNLSSSSKHEEPKEAAEELLTNEAEEYDTEEEDPDFEAEQEIDDFALIGAFDQLSVSENKVQGSKQERDGEVRVHHPPSKATKQVKTGTTAILPTAPLTPPRPQRNFAWVPPRNWQLPSFATPPRVSARKLQTPPPQPLIMSAAVELSSSPSGGEGYPPQPPPLGSYENPKVLNLSLITPTRRRFRHSKFLMSPTTTTSAPCI